MILKSFFVAGANDEPNIVSAGLMPLQGSHFDTTTGYVKFVNRTRSGGMSTSARDLVTEAPMCHTVQLHGCYRFEGADYYRILKRTPMADRSILPEETVGQAQAGTMTGFIPGSAQDGTSQSSMAQQKHSLFKY